MEGDHDGTALDRLSPSVPKRGVSLRTVWKGVLQRFLPSAALMTGVYAAFEISAAPDRWITPTLFFASALIGLTAGFGLGLEMLRRWLYEDAGIAHRRSVIAGLMAPVAFFIIAVLDPSGTGFVDGILYSL